MRSAAPPSPPPPIRRLGLRRGLARAAILWERVWPAVAPLLGVLGVFGVIALTGLLPLLPGWLHLLLLAAFLCAACVAIVWGARQIRLPGGAEVGQRLIQSPRTHAVAFTGSVPTGRKVLALAGSQMKHATMELGGKSPLIIFDDADVENAVGGAMLANFYSTGQVCSNGTRVFVQRGIYERFMDRLTQRTAKIRIGDPLDPATQMGPLVSKAQHEKVTGYIGIGRDEGATLHYGGGVPQLQGFEDGFFVEPTIFTDVRDDMRIAREEIFGPVMSVLSFTGEDEVVERANDTEFGLSAGVFSRDLSRAHRVVAELKAGSCWINHYNLAPLELPFGGYKQSGIGRENSLAALAHYSQLKSVYVETGDVISPY